MHIQAINTVKKEMAEQITTKRAYIQNKPYETLNNGTGLQIPGFEPLLIN